MIDAKQLLDSFLGQGGQGGQGAGKAGTLALGAAAGGILATLLGSKSVRKAGGKALGYGGAAVLGGLAYKAWQTWSQNQAAAKPAAQPPAGGPFDLTGPADDGSNDARLALVKAMIAAAKADGHIDAREQQQVFDRIGKLGLSAEAKAMVFDELGKPLDVGAIAALARSPEHASEIWLASRLAIDPDDARERTYLDDLARRMNLPAGLVAQLETETRAALAAPA